MTFEPTRITRDDLKRAGLTMIEVAAEAQVAPWRVRNGFGGGWAYLTPDEHHRIARALAKLLPEAAR